MITRLQGTDKTAQQRHTLNINNKKDQIHFIMRCAIKGLTLYWPLRIGLELLFYQEDQRCVLERSFLWSHWLSLNLLKQKELCTFIPEALYWPLRIGPEVLFYQEGLWRTLELSSLLSHWLCLYSLKRERTIKAITCMYCLMVSQ